MRLTKMVTLKNMEDAAALQAWTTGEQLKQGDLSDFQRAFFLNALARSYLTLSIDIVDAHDLLAQMVETAGDPPPAPVKKLVPRTKKPTGAPKAAAKKTLPPKKLQPRKKT